MLVGIDVKARGRSHERTAYRMRQTVLLFVRQQHDSILDEYCTADANR